MTQDELKKAVGWAALDYVRPGTIVGVGTGSTAAHFIDALASVKHQIEGAVSSSDASTARLKSLGIPVFDCNDVDVLDVYVDGADEINPHMQMIKGGGAALTREKIVAAIARQFVCIVDASKQVDVLGRFPLPVEVIPMARATWPVSWSSWAGSRYIVTAWLPTTATSFWMCTTWICPMRWRWKIVSMVLPAW